MNWAPTVLLPAAKGYPQHVLRRVDSRPRRNGVRVRPVKFVQGDAVEGDAHVVLGLLQLPGSLIQVDAVAVGFGNASHRPFP
jgi:hypothetical protein